MCISQRLERCFYDPLISLLNVIKGLSVPPRKSVSHVSRCHALFELDACKLIWRSLSST